MVACICIRCCQLVGYPYPTVEGPSELRMRKALPPLLRLSGDEEGSRATAASCGLRNCCKQSDGSCTVILCLGIASRRLSHGAAWIWDAFIVRLTGRLSLPMLLPCIRTNEVKQGADIALVIECPKYKQFKIDRCCCGADRSGDKDFADRRRWEFWKSARSALKAAQ